MLRFAKIPARDLKHGGRFRRLRAVRRQLPTALAATARTAGMVALAVLLILVLLPAMLGAQAASIR
jgi:hypothetical protein